MQATIYVTEEAMATAIAIKDLHYYDRLTMSDDQNTDLSQSPGYFLKNPNKLHLAVLPEGANIAASLNVSDSKAGALLVNFPANLRGCIFDRAPNLPPQYAEIVTYWSGEALNAQDSRAVHFQSPLNEYLVELKSADDNDAYAEQVACDKLLSEGIVAQISGLTNLTSTLAPTDFIEVLVPIDGDMVGVEPDSFRSHSPYGAPEDSLVEKIYIAVADIIRSPNPDTIFIDIIRTEMIDYGYIY
jgi:hypothetical protein